MESQVLDERVDQESQRVAVALGINVWHQRYWMQALRKYLEVRKYVGYAEHLYVTCYITPDGWSSLEFGTTKGLQAGQLCGPISSVHLGSDGRWLLCLQADSPMMYMARGLYRLGFDERSIRSQLPALSAHEKLELRLSMPREFWPKKWVDEEKEKESSG